MKTIFNLQLFAEGEAPEGKPTETEAKPEAKSEVETPETKPAAEPKYTDKDLDEIISKKFAKWQTKKQEEIDEAKKLAQMTTEERLKHENETISKKLAELETQATRGKMVSTARQIMKEDGVDVSDKITSSLIAEDAEKTKENVVAFTTAFKKAVQAEVKKQLSGQAPTKGKAANKGITKEQIMAIKDRGERKKLIRENIELFR